MNTTEIRKRGPKKMEVAVARGRQVMVRLNEKELAIVKARAWDAHESCAAYLRRCGLEGK